MRLIKRIERIRQMSFSLIKTKISYKFSIKRFIRLFAYKFNDFSLKLFDDNYTERPEAGPINLDVKLQRINNGGTFESPVTVIANMGAIQLARDFKLILEVGCGTGFFAYNISENPAVRIVASEFDDGARNWAIENRSRSNIEYCKKSLNEFQTNEFELVVALEVIEHIYDYSTFLKDISKVAKTAIISTPNKNRDYNASIANTPEYDEHVREWTAGEFYWVLRTFFGRVDLYTVKNLRKLQKQFINGQEIKPSIERVGLLTREHILIALCKN